MTGRENFLAWLAGSRASRLPETSRRYQKLEEGFRKIIAIQARLPKEKYLTPLIELSLDERKALYKAAMKVLDRAEVAKNILGTALDPEAQNDARRKG